VNLVFGIMFVLVGALAFHVAASGVSVHTPVEVWRDMLKVARGEAIS
jgi:hypothetical protein